MYPLAAAGVVCCGPGSCGQTGAGDPAPPCHKWNTPRGLLERGERRETQHGVETISKNSKQRVNTSPSESADLLKLKKIFRVGSGTGTGTTLPTLSTNGIKFSFGFLKKIYTVGRYLLYAEYMVNVCIPGLRVSAQI